LYRSVDRPIKKRRLSKMHSSRSKSSILCRILLVATISIFGRIRAENSRTFCWSATEFDPFETRDYIYRWNWLDYAETHQSWGWNHQAAFKKIPKTISAKNRNYVQKSRFFLKILNFRQKSTCWLRIELFCGKWNFVQKTTCWLKIEIMSMLA